MEANNALAKIDREDALVMHASPAEAKRQLQELQAFIKEAMIEGTDYGTIPGTDKPTLYQPGAQKLCELYGLAHDFVDIEAVQNWDKGFFFYRKRCVITMRRNGLFAGAGVGSCNSREDRYAWRWVPDFKLPKGAKTDGLKYQERDGKRGKFTVYRMPNEDIYSLVNTIEKMACKRSLVHAVIGVTRSANLFTQDVEDLPAEVFGEAEERRPWERVQDAEIVQPAAAVSASPEEAKLTDSLQLIASFKERIGKAADIAALRKIGEELNKQPAVIKNAVRAEYGSKKASFEKKATANVVAIAERQPGEEG